MVLSLRLSCYRPDVMEIAYPAVVNRAFNQYKAGGFKISGSGLCGEMILMDGTRLKHRSGFVSSRVQHIFLVKKEIAAWFKYAENIFQERAGGQDVGQDMMCQDIDRIEGTLKGNR